MEKNTYNILGQDQTFNINYDNDVYHNQNYVKIYDFEGREAKFIFNQKRKPESVDLIRANGTRMNTSLKYSSQADGGGYIDAATSVKDYPRISFNEELVSKVQIRYSESGTNEFNEVEDIENGQYIWEPFGERKYGLFEITTYDFFNNKNTKYVEVLEHSTSPKLFDQDYFDTEYGSAFLDHTSSVGFTHNDIKNMNSDDINSILAETTDFFSLSSQEFDVQKLISNSVYDGTINNQTTFNQLIPSIENYVLSSIYSGNNQVRREDLEFSYSFEDGSNFDQQNIIGKTVTITILPTVVDVDKEFNREYSGSIGKYQETLYIAESMPYDLRQLDIDNQKLSSDIGELISNDKTFGDIKDRLNFILLNEINSQKDPLANEVYKNDIEIEWYGFINGFEDKILLDNTTNLADLETKNLSYRIRGINEKTFNSYNDHIDIDFYHLVWINDLKIETIENNFTVWKGTTFEEIESWAETEIYRNIKNQVLTNPDFNGELMLSDFSFFFDTDSSKVFTQDVHEIEYGVILDTKHYRGSLKGKIEITTDVKINSITDIDYDEKELKSKYSFLKDFYDEDAKLKDVKDQFEHIILTELNSSFLFRLNNENDDLTKEDIQFSYSISSDESIYQDFDVKFRYVYARDDAWYTMSFNLKPAPIEENNFNPALITTAVLSSMVFFTLMYFIGGSRRIGKK